MSIFNKMSFKSKLILVTCIINVVVISCSLYLRSKHFETTFKESMAFRTQIIANVIADSISDEIKLDHLVRVERYRDLIVKEPEIEYVAFFSNQDKLIATAGNFNKNKIKFETENIFNMVDNVYDVYKEIKGDDGRKIGSVIIGFPVQSLKNAVHKNLMIGIIVWVTAGIIIIILNFVSLNYFLKPIKLLYEGSVRIANKEFCCRIPVRNEDEIGKISLQFNVMAGELESFYEDLERKVKEATIGLVEANTRLKEINEKKSEFVEIVSHDLRTPLTSILGFADTVLNKNLKLSEKDKDEYVNIIGIEARRLGRLISDFLDISKIEEGRLELNLKKISIEGVIRRTVRSIDTKTYGVGIDVEIEKDLPEIYLDSDRIRQVFQNIIGNALKYSPRDSVIKLTAGKSSNEVRIAIIDHGPGIADDKKKIIFEKFYRVDDDVSRKERGTGLGLSIAKSIVEMHGGKIWVEDNPGFSGSCFIFTLPIKD
ncbi:MAG: ATP-binding protein [Elusimicrobia bacterium]|nr:ATP-binding protein [Elusimicrobiota bacterium]